MKEFHEPKSSNADNKGNRFAALEDVVGSWLPHQEGELLHPLRLAEVTGDSIISTGEFLCLVLLGMKFLECLVVALYQITAMITEGCNDGEASPVVYISGEEEVPFGWKPLVSQLLCLSFYFLPCH